MNSKFEHLAREAGLGDVLDDAKLGNSASQFVLGKWLAQRYTKQCSAFFDQIFEIEPTDAENEEHERLDNLQAEAI